MAREYPRFIYSNPQNTKSKGPFVIHTIYPRFIASVKKNGNQYSFLVDCWDDIGSTSRDLESAVEAMKKWFSVQLKLNAH